MGNLGRIAGIIGAVGVVLAGKVIVARQAKSADPA
jgi:hypothetical protein